MRKLLIIVSLVIAVTSCQAGLKAQSSKFDKDKWLISSDYRYEDSKTCFPDLRGKSKEDVKELLGDPSVVSGEQFIYCFDINVKAHYNDELKHDICNCKGASVIIDFEIDERWRTTFIYTE